MNQLDLSEAVVAHNEDALQELVWALEALKGQFSLMLAHCNYVSLRQQMLEQIKERCSLAYREISLPESAQTLYTTLREELTDDKPAALMVLGLESVRDIDRLIAATNQVREEFRKNFPFPLVLWVNDRALRKLIQLAPDFESWSTTTDFSLPTDILIRELRQSADALFTRLLELPVGQFFDRDALFNSSERLEIDSALQDLRERGQELEPDLQASVEFALGREDYLRDEIEAALEHYQKSLAFWQETHQLERQGILLFHIGLCYSRQAQECGNGTKCELSWQEARKYFQESVEVLEKAQRLDVVARLINSLGEALEHLEKWEYLDKLAQQSRQLHQTYPDSSLLAQDYGFLAEVALHQSRPQDACNNAQQALDILTELPEEQRSHESFYLLLLAQSQHELGQDTVAIANLERIRIEKWQEEPRLSIRALKLLRDLYFHNHQYLKAFEVKQEGRSIEQRYGLSAFIGAVRLKSQLQAKSALATADLQATIAQEIAASGRQEDVSNLIQRIKIPQHKLTIVYGQSGVGKSSVMEAGLIPALKQETVEGRKIVPVLLRVYADWERELSKRLREALKERKVSNNLTTSKSNSAQEILEQLCSNQSHNLFTVLVFDQFEEFFFICHDPAIRGCFSEFFKNCLNTPFVKVILSLREDYLHLLLQCSRHISLDAINNNILDKDILYYLGNFSPSATKSIISQLTERSHFHLEPALIDKLVEDLAKELEEVRPIELQVVGAQLQTDDIKTLDKYYQLGQNPKERLVQKYLEEVIADCGTENQKAAELVLYLLTAENNTRPLKTHDQLQRELEDVASIFETDIGDLDLVLDIFVKSGMVLLLPAVPTERYQLVHDYLVSFIRQVRSAHLIEEMEELKHENYHLNLTLKSKKEELEIKNKELEDNNLLLRRTQRSKFLAMTTVSVVLILGTLWGINTVQKTRNYDIQKMAQGSESLYNVNKDSLDTLVEALSTASQFRQLNSSINWLIEPKTQTDVLKVLQAAVTGVEGFREKNRLDNYRNNSKDRKPVISVGFSPNGKLLALASQDGKLKIWDGKNLQSVDAHQGSINSITFSPDGKTIATASADKTVKIWSNDGKFINKLYHPDQVNSVSFSKDGILATASSNKVYLWQEKNGKWTQKIPPLLYSDKDEVSTVSFSDDGKILATASKNEVRLWNKQGNLLKSIPYSTSKVGDVSISPDGKILAVARDDKKIEIWSLNKEGVWENVQTLPQVPGDGHEDSVLSVNFSPDGNILVSTGADRQVKLWGRSNSGEPFKLLKTLSGHKFEVRDATFSRDGKMLATASDDGTVRIWSQDEQEFPRLNKHTKLVMGISFDPNNKDKMIASASFDGTVKLWNLKGKELPNLPQNHDKDKLSSLTFSRDSQIIVATCVDKNKLLIWKRKGNQWENSIISTTNNTDKQGFWDVDFSHDGKLIATAGKDGKIKLWSLEGKLLSTLTGHKDIVRSIRFSPDDKSKTLASASYDGTIKLWNLEGKAGLTFKKDFKGHEQRIININFSPDGKILASASFDGTAKLWDMNGNELKTLQGHTNWLTRVSFSPDGKTIATASDDKTIKLWNLEGQELQTILGHPSRVTNVTFSPDGKVLASSDGDDTHGTIILWDLQQIRNPDRLVKRGCKWVRDYLNYKAKLNNLSKSEEQANNLCKKLVPQL